MTDDWQDFALSTRHFHNRNNRRASGKGKKGAAFDVRKTFGEYEVKCASWERALGELCDDDGQEEEAVFELLRLTEDGQGVLGELVLPGVLRAAVVLAASRKTLTIITRHLSGEDQDEETSDEDENEDHDASDDDEEEEQQPDRFATFEKNSFRSPKFWLAWNGTITTPKDDSPPPSPTHTRKGSHFPSADSPPPSPTLSRTGSSFPPPKPTSISTQQSQAEGLGYVVFTGNDCRKFKGTLNCKELGWKDIAFSGFKSVSRSESDRQVVWAGRDAETGWKEESADGGDRGARLDSRRRVVFD
ncbi:hypothetical protein BU25DRAFT_169355 [Macroventuria anomochaeta]|uniref:Uncharacterized protein n=1 Tax=Macroventuria anomochaeta TaxID=301207 RepID=A0ACB6RPN5_9PLEO|nr:uncharacterized protein BU25DRAFT_169355 [Macroventuria anomochaeta]KAF2623861.1 hypothetical protein BU25DRAFT_169355 [Macroventuria anomochaeta]